MDTDKKEAVESWELFLDFLENAPVVQDPNVAIADYCASLKGVSVKDFIMQGFPDDLITAINSYLEATSASSGSREAVFNLIDAIDSLPVQKLKRRVCLV